MDGVKIFRAGDFVPVQAVSVADYNAALAREADLQDELHLTAEERDHAKRNSSAFEERMGDLQVENGKLADQLAALLEELERQTDIAHASQVKCNKLEFRLTAAEQRNEFLEAQVAAKDVGIDFRDAMINSVRMSSTELLAAWVPHDWEAKRQTLLSNAKPTESGASDEPQCLLCLDTKTVPGNVPGGFVKDCPDCCGEEG